ncbi:synaptic plasticity regulator PANTS isoform X2 [Petaurus breviceps papuanus]|uniref:synaptic plasticity regulator PANTS isoform X2 n=1 Tax=Petaurus breviceps papuanus TaxID=3040969 RepID=UPI0036D9BC53
MSIPPTSGLTPSIGCYPEEAGRVRSCKMADAEENFWRPPRSCEDYWAEWKHCRTLRNLLHHYYTYGETPACAQWKRDYRHCRQWEESGSAEAKRCLWESEQARILAKQKHPPVWTLRQRPPTDWHLPLPGEEKSK